jgi:transposase
MPKNIVKNVTTRAGGFAPILRYFFHQCGIADIIDNHIPTDPRRKVLTHGEAGIAMITGILFQVMQLYRICRFASETTALKVLLPNIEPDQYFDDRLADTLDALYRYGLGNLEMMITRQMISSFNIQTDICHNDTTTASVYGDYNNKLAPDTIDITFGFNKKHRDDLKQLVWSLSVSSDSAFPLFQQAYSGNRADVTTYVEQWLHLIDLLDDRAFLYVGDSKLASRENLAYIHDHDGFFLAPLPMYESYKTALHKAIDHHDHELLLPHKGGFNRGFEVALPIEHEDRSYPFRMIILYDQALFARKRKTLENRIGKTKAAFDELATKLNKYQLKTREAIDKACQKILKKNQTAEFFTYRIENDPEVTYKNKRRGRQPKNGQSEKVAVTTDKFSVELVFNPEAFEKALDRCGYYPLVTNKSSQDLPIEAAMKAHKDQYKVEHTNRRAKGSYRLEPIYIHTPQRIEAYLFLFKIALQIVGLIERNARASITSRDRGLDDFMPNKKDYRTPKAEYLLQKFEHVVSGEMQLPDNETYGFVSELTELQQDILQILEVPEECYTYEYLFDTS